MLEEKSETVGRYVLHAPIARGGMATVHAARLTGAEGFNRLVAAKRLHPELLEDPEFITMFHDEARIASRIHHPNVVPVLDVVVTDKEVMLVQEYVHGVPLSVLMRRARQALKPIPLPIAVAIAAGVLAGLHAAHEAKDDGGIPLDVIHRDVSPQNVILSVEGVPRLLDFGIAKARSSAHLTRAGVVKGKLSYLSPEQIRIEPITRRVDIYAAGVVLWELIANRRVSEAMSEGDFLVALFDDAIPTLVEECSVWRRSMGQAGWKRLIAIDAVAMRAMSLPAEERFATALQMAEALVAAHPPASQSEVAAWVCRTGSDHLAKLQRTLAESEEHWRSELRLETATISRKSIVVAHDEDDRVTLPMPDAYPPSDPGPQASREPIDDGLRAAIERRGGEPSERVRAAREADTPSERARAARDADLPSERARAARDADLPSERTRAARDADLLSERARGARDARDADVLSERGERIRASRAADEPSERTRAARDADVLSERGERMRASRAADEPSERTRAARAARDADVLSERGERMRASRAADEPSERTRAARAARDADVLSERGKRMRASRTADEPSERTRAAREADELVERAERMRACDADEPGERAGAALEAHVPSERGEWMRASPGADEPSERTRAGADEPSERTRVGADEPSERTRVGADEPSERTRAGADEPSGRTRAARDADDPSERGEWMRVSRDADEPSERVRASRASREDELVGRGERIWARRNVGEREGEPSEPPESLAAVERGMPLSPPTRRSRYVAWLAAAVVVVGLGAVATRRGSGGAAGAPPAQEGRSRTGTTVRSSVSASGEASAFPSTTVTGAARATRLLTVTSATDTPNGMALATATTSSGGTATPGPASPNGAPAAGATGTTRPGATTFAPPSLLLPASFFAPSSGLAVTGPPKAGPAAPTACASAEAPTQPAAAGGPAEGGTDGGGFGPPAPSIVSTPKVVRGPAAPPTLRAAHDCKPLYDSVRHIFITPPGCHR